MKKSIFALVVFILFSFQLLGQIELPRVSQKASVMQRIGLTDVTITYSRPNVKSRMVWGDLVPYNQVWRTGADEATNISFSEDVTINGNKVAAGKYALFTIPGKSNWTIILNSVAKQWGAFNYDSTKDVLRFTVKSHENKYTESLQFTFSDVSVNSANINIEWDKVKVSFPIEIDFDSHSYKNIKEAIANAKEDDWIIYAIAGNYTAEYDLHLSEGLEWINKSITIKETYFNHYVKSRILMKLGKIQEAWANLEKSKQLGKSDKDFHTFHQNIDKLEAELKTHKSIN